MINKGSKVLLEVKNLKAEVAGVEILKGVDLTVRAGEVHAIMGINGSGKSTFSKVLAGHPDYAVTGGSAVFEGKDLFSLAPEERARAGIFLAFQYPVEISGVSNSALLRLAYNTLQTERGLEELDPLEFDDLIQEKIKIVEMDPSFLGRSVNEGGKREEGFGESRGREEEASAQFSRRCAQSIPRVPRVRVRKTRPYQGPF